MPRPLRLAGGRLSDRVRLDDAFDRGCSFDQCIAGLLRISFGAASDPDEAARHAEGFRYVEALDPRDLARYRYQAGIGVVRWLTAAEIDRAFAATGEHPGPAVYGRSSSARRSTPSARRMESPGTTSRPRKTGRTASPAAR